MDIRLRRMVGGGLWGVGFVVAVVWGTLRDVGAEGRGYGFAPPVRVAALETGLVQEIAVDLHQVVEPGDIVVKMDPAPLQDERAVVSARLLAAQEIAASETANDVRRFAEGVEGVMVDQARLSTQVQEDRALLANLQERLSIELDLANSGASSDQAVEEWRRQIRVVEARIRAGSSALAVVNEAANAARERTSTLPVGTPTERWEVVAAAKELDAIDGRIDRMNLRSAVSGQVTQIYRTAGEVVPAGEPVLEVRSLGTRDVVAFLQPGEVGGLQQGDKATVRRATGQVVSGRLVSVGSGPQPLPEALWHNPQSPEYAVPVRIELDGEVGPDEPVVVRL
jgi:multidrug resistance efflux pump